jgi:calcineurin-like phosphoesterase family protein
MIKIDTNTNVFLVSDTHFSHKNICRGVTNWRLPNGEIPVDQTRDFPTIEKMNTAIVNNINQVVGQDDILIHLGDFSFGGFDQIREFYNRLVCKNIHLILGNHDTHIEKNRENIQDLFLSVSHYNTLEYKNRAGTTHKFVLCHYPICSWHDMKKGVYHLFGHLHTPNQNKIMGGRSMDVGMDGNDLKPYNIDDIVRKLSGRPIMFNTLKDDHHLDDIKGIVG